jgi:Tol biopolymer transport system component
VYTTGTNEFMFLTIVEADGSNRTRLTRLEDVTLPDGTIGTPTMTLEDWHPTWSPNGERIVFVSNRAGYSDIYIMNDDGTGITQITNDYFRDYEPIWASNEEIVFVSDREGSMQIFLMDLTTRDIRRLTWMPLGANAPAWLP